jgi:hypothetical protein
MYEARRRSSELGLGERDLVVTRQQLDELTDGLFVLAGTIGDARRALDDVETLEESIELLQTVLDAAAPLLPSG